MTAPEVCWRKEVKPGKKVMAHDATSLQRTSLRVARFLRGQRVLGFDQLTNLLARACWVNVALLFDRGDFVSQPLVLDRTPYPLRHFVLAQVEPPRVIVNAVA